MIELNFRNYLQFTNQNIVSKGTVFRISIGKAYLFFIIILGLYSIALSIR